MKTYLDHTGNIHSWIHFVAKFIHMTSSIDYHLWQTKDSTVSGINQSLSVSCDDIEDQQRMIQSFCVLVFAISL